MSASKTYALDGKALSDDLYQRSFTTLLEAYRPTLARASIDAVPAGFAGLPASAREALSELSNIGIADHRRRRRTWLKRVFSLPSDPLMNVQLDLRSPRHLQLLDAFGPFSIHAAVYVDASAVPVITVDDGVTIVFDADSRILDFVISGSGLPQDAIEDLSL